jgi:hypothetical protein
MSASVAVTEVELRAELVVVGDVCGEVVAGRDVVAAAVVDVVLMVAAEFPV